MTSKKQLNRLQNEQSIYLKNLSSGPIDWWPFGPSALQKSQDENKPIFMSIGHFSCHFCQIMTREIFQNTEIAQFINDNYIPIKIDREEYPDLDNFMQVASHIYSRKSGWPLSAFLLPNLRPFYAGTFLPLETIEENIGLKQLIRELSHVYHNDQLQVKENANKVYDAIIEGNIPKTKAEYAGHFPHPMAILEAINELKDKKNGGYGPAPKF